MGAESIFIVPLSTVKSGVIEVDNENVQSLITCNKFDILAEVQPERVMKLALSDTKPFMGIMYGEINDEALKSRFEYIPNFCRFTEIKYLQDSGGHKIINLVGKTVSDEDAGPNYTHKYEMEHIVSMYDHANNVYVLLGRCVTTVGIGNVQAYERGEYENSATSREGEFEHQELERVSENGDLYYVSGGISSKGGFGYERAKCRILGSPIGRVSVKCKFSSINGQRTFNEEMLKALEYHLQELFEVALSLKSKASKTYFCVEIDERKIAEVDKPVRSFDRF